MTQDIYVASSWRNRHYGHLVAALRAAGHRVYDFREEAFRWSELDSTFPNWDVGQFLNALENPVAVDHFHLDERAMQWCTCGVLCLPAGRSAHLEAGWIVGREKPLVIFAPGNALPGDIEPELMYLLAGSPANTFALSYEDVVTRVDAL